MRPIKSSNNFYDWNNACVKRGHSFGKEYGIFFFFFEKKECKIEVDRVLIVTSGILMNGVGLCQHQASNAKMSSSN